MLQILLDYMTCG